MVILHAVMCNGAYVCDCQNSWTPKLDDAVRPSEHGILAQETDCLVDSCDCDVSSHRCCITPILEGMSRESSLSLGQDVFGGCVGGVHWDGVGVLKTVLAL
eukprot:4426571-Amphidinium_carterae.1